MNQINNFFSRFNTQYFFGVPADTATVWFWFGFFALALLVTGVYSIYLSRKASKLKPYKSYLKTFFWPNLAFNLIGMLLAIFRYETIAILYFRFWVFLDLAILATFNIWFFVKRRELLLDEIENLQIKERKDKWMPKPKNKRKKIK